MGKRDDIMNLGGVGCETLDGDRGGSDVSTRDKGVLAEIQHVMKGK